MNLEKLFEISSKSLKKLGDVKAVNVAADYPEDFARILFKELEKENIKIKPKTKTEIINHIRSELTDNMSPINPWFKDRGFVDFTAEGCKHSVAISLFMKENKALWGIQVAYMGRSKETTKPISLTSITATELWSKIAKNVKKLIDAGAGERDADKYKEALEVSKSMKAPSLKISKIIKRVTENYMLSFSVQEKEDRKSISMSINPSLEKYGIGGEYSEALIKTNVIWPDKDDLLRFKYSFQLDELKKAWSIILKRIETNGYLIIDGGSFAASRDYFWFKVDIVNPNHKNLRWKDSTYQEAHDEIKKKTDTLFDETLVEEMSLSEFMRKVVENIFTKVKDV